jgi:uncharacterized membrane protein
MSELLLSMIAIDDYTQVVVICSVIAALWLVRTTTQSTALTIIFSPAILFGALAANYLFRVHFVVAAHDKDTNVVVASAVGVVMALVLMLMASWIAISMSERRRRSHQPLLPHSKDASASTH